MYKIYLLAVLLIFTFNSKAQTEIPLEIADGGYIFIKVRLNDTDSARFMLDTGGGVNVMSSQLFSKLKSTLKLIGQHTGIRHNGEAITGTLYELPSLSIGSFKKNNVVIGEYAALNNFDGLLSMDYFRDVPFTIDFINKKLILETKESMTAINARSEKIPIQLKTNGKNELEFFVKICVNDSLQANAEFDTGSGFAMLMLHPKYMAPLHITAPIQKPQDMSYYIQTTSVAKLSYCAVPSLVQTNHFAGFKEGLIYEGLIGSGMFSKTKLTIDIPSGTMIVRK